jgi:PST family polysaccharide transporter
MALAGNGVWSLVAAQITQSATNLMMVYYYTLHPIGFYFSYSKSLINFGAIILITNIANWIILNIDNTLIGRYYGAENLGLYARHSHWR